MGAGALAITAAADFASTAYANRLQTRAAHEAQDFSAQQFETRYQRQVQDLKKAGLNPMLAYGQSPGSSPQGIQPQMRVSESGKMINEGRIVSAQVGAIEADTALKYSEKRKVDAESITEMLRPMQIATSSEQAQEQANVLRATIAKIDAEIDNIEQQKKKGVSDVKLNESLISLNNAKRMVENAQEQLLKNQKAKIAGEAKAGESWSGTVAAHAANLWSVISPVADFIPFAPGSSGTKRHPDYIKARDFGK